MVGIQPTPENVEKVLLVHDIILRKFATRNEVPLVKGV